MESLFSRFDTFLYIYSLLIICLSVLLGYLYIDATKDCYTDLLRQSGSAPDFMVWETTLHCKCIKRSKTSCNAIFNASSMRRHKNWDYKSNLLEDRCYKMQWEVPSDLTERQVLCVWRKAGLCVLVYGQSELEQIESNTKLMIARLNSFTLLAQQWAQHIRAACTLVYNRLTHTRVSVSDSCSVLLCFQNI